MNVLATPVTMEEHVTIRSTSLLVLVQNNIPGPCAKMVIIFFNSNIFILLKKNHEILFCCSYAYSFSKRSSHQAFIKACMSENVT